MDITNLQPSPKALDIACTLRAKRRAPRSALVYRYKVVREWMFTRNQKHCVHHVSLEEGRTTARWRVLPDVVPAHPGGVAQSGAKH